MTECVHIDPFGRVNQFDSFDDQHVGTVFAELTPTALLLAFEVES
jgi:hypothetical protein